MRPVKKLLILSFALPLACASNAIIIRDDVADSKYTDLAADPLYDAVGRINYTTSGATGVATGNFIGTSDGKKWLVSAAHVLDQGITAATFTVAGRAYDLKVSSIRYISNYDSGKWDIGVAQILDPDNNLTIDPVRFSNATVPIPAKVDDHIIATGVGFGRTGDGKTGSTKASGTKRAFNERIDALGLTYNQGRGQLFGYISDFDDGKASGNTLDATDFAAARFSAGQASVRDQLDLEGNVAEGDSGGGLFMDDGCCSTVMIGIASVSNRLGSGGLYTYGANSIWSPIDKDMADKITGWTGIAAVPEPCTYIVLGLGIAAFQRRRR